MCDLIDYVSDKVGGEMDPNLVSDWLHEYLNKSGPWNNIQDDRLKISSLISCRLSHCARDTYDLRQRLYRENVLSSWVVILTREALPLLYEEIEYGDW